MTDTPNPNAVANFEVRIEQLRNELLALEGPDLTAAKGLLYGYADDALDQASDELDLVFGEDDHRVITDAEAAGINAYIEAAGRILKAAHSD